MCPMYTYINAVLEKKCSVSADIIVILWSESFRMCRAAVTPEIPFPIMAMCFIGTFGNAKVKFRLTITCLRYDN